MAVPADGVSAEPMAPDDAVGGVLPIDPLVLPKGGMGAGAVLTLGIAGSGDGVPGAGVGAGALGSFDAGGEVVLVLVGEAVGAGVSTGGVAAPVVVCAMAVPLTSKAAASAMDVFTVILLLSGRFGRTLNRLRTRERSLCFAGGPQPRTTGGFSRAMRG